MNQDNTVRFIATDTTDMEPYSLKLFFKGDPSESKFYNQNNDPTYNLSVNECKNYKVIINRLYNKAQTNIHPISKNDHPIYDDINLPECLTVQDSGLLKTNFINIFSLPEGVKLDKKCLKGERLTKTNSCLPYLRIISSGLLHALDIFNMGNTFFKHGNIAPQNIYLAIRNDTQRVFLDNMVFDNNKYDNINQKPFRSDMNMMGDTLIQLITGTKKNILKGPIEGAFDIYHAVRKYFYDNHFDISLKSVALNMPANINDGYGKHMTRSELEFKLQKSVFNFIYRLKCTGTNPVNQFMDINQAINHDFIKTKDVSENKTVANTGDQWDALPSDF
jgi:hypothetical protein